MKEATETLERKRREETKGEWAGEKKEGVVRTMYVEGKREERKRNRGC